MNRDRTTLRGITKHDNTKQQTVDMRVQTNMAEKKREKLKRNKEKQQRDEDNKPTKKIDREKNAGETRKI